MLIRPGLLTLAMLAVLVGLGVWQVRRLAWKTALLAAIDRAEAAPAVPLGPDPPPFQKVRVRGRLGEPHALYGVEVRETAAGPQMGAQLLAPLLRPGAPPIVADLGWAPDARPAPLALRAGETEITGYVRPAERPGPFSPSDDLAARHFYTLDPQKIGLALGLPRAAPFTLVALGPVRPGVYPEPAHALPRPPNNHLSYAVTWFGLAATLLAVFLAWSLKALRA